ncbi:HAD-IA family hydrolase [Patescibacteria group bacterium]|nr:HAD-IA family hydrolase [Patescibacteria group bacterium]MCG2702220.1 HAD-IA family hydrolase [Candidatus Parcubacteria bacterium]MBU4210002.1 HAD-IA family hydrolase [Patescibacteria group bacterium]MBU4264766.1 HAD-IA family hydrolase [Patescibacteria group bacterium]MBU4390104.1 HAD-IA family hydrolase [Patescibacteria group bacterium]
MKTDYKAVIFDISNVLILPNSRPNLELIQTIKKLKKASVKTVVISNTSSTIRQKFKRLSNFSLDDLFDQIFISQETGLFKPNHKIFQLALNKLNLSPDQCIFVDDITRNIDSAQELGITTILFINTQSCINKLEKLLSTTLH